MIRTEEYMTREDGTVLIRTYSDAGYKIERDGVQYDEAIDPQSLSRTYTETDTLIDENITEEEKAFLDSLISEVANE